MTHFHRTVRSVSALVLIGALAVAAPAVTSTAAQAADEVNVANGLTLNGNPLGLHGFDPTAAVDGLGPTLGEADFTATHNGVDYYFASAEALDRFLADPTGNLPHYGGFCAFGVWLGKKLDGDVRFADIVDGKLYLFVNRSVFETYLDDPESVIAGAEAAWPTIRSTPVSDL